MTKFTINILLIFEILIIAVFILPLCKISDAVAISDRNMLMFIHVPKSGGTTIEDSKLFADAKHPSVGGHQTVEQHFKHRNATYDQYLTAAVIRHPCERFMSAFFFFYNKKAYGGEQFIAKHFRSWENPCTFINLLRLDETIHYDEPHFLPMYHWLYLSNGTFGIDELIFFERYNEGLHKLENTLVSRSKLRNGTTFFDEGLYTAAHSLADPHSHCETLTDRCQMHIEQFYHLDYCLFGYTRNASYVPPLLSKAEYTWRMQSVCNAVSMCPPGNDTKAGYSGCR